MTERRGIMNRIAALEEEIREHYRKSDLERMHAEAKEASMKNLKSILSLTARKTKNGENDAQLRPEGEDSVRSSTVS